jgi:quercetin dioxygenase-like cupin family protein
VQIRADYDTTTAVPPAAFTWVPSPASGVERVMLDRLGGEVAVATSLVRYAPGARFATHEHGGGEEFLVLEGEFGDEQGRYPAGTYVRNPIGTAHAPFSEPGCLLFVKLRQFSPRDVRQFSIRLPEDPPTAGWTSQTLHAHEGEIVQWLQTAADTPVSLPASVHMRELLVFRGSVAWQSDRTEVLGSHGWLRLAPGEPLRVRALEPSLLLAKTRPRFDLELAA